MVTVVTKENFDTFVKKTASPYCWISGLHGAGPCRMLAPVIEQFAAENPSIAVGKINVDEQGVLAEMHGIMSIPTLVVYKNGVKTAPGGRRQKRRRNSGACQPTVSFNNSAVVCES